MRPLHEKYFDKHLQLPVIEWPDGYCPRCGDDEGFFHDTDGARRCRECNTRFCALCGVKMSVHFSCTIAASPPTGSCR